MKRILIPLMTVLAGAPVFAHEGARVSPEARQQIFDEELTKLTGDLGLDAQGTAKVRATFDKYRGEMAPVRKQTWDAQRALRQELSTPQPNEQRVTQLTDQLIAGRQQLRAIEVERTQALRQQLTPSQFAKLMLERHRFGRDVRRPLREQRSAAAPSVK